MTLKKLIEQLVAETIRDMDESPESRGAFAQDLRDMGLEKPANAMSVPGVLEIGRPLKQLFHKHADHEWMSKLITIHFLSSWTEPADLFTDVTSKDELSCTAFLPGHTFTKEDFWRKIGVVVKGHITYLANDMDDIYSGYGKQYTDIAPERTRDSGANKGIERRFGAHEYEEHPYLVLDKDDWKKNPHRSNEALVDNWRPVAIVFKEWPNESSQAWLEDQKERLKKQGIDVPLLSLEEFNKLV